MSRDTSLLAPPEGSVIIPAVQWLESALLGSLATVVATLAIAGVGFLMLSGRFEPRRASIVILGCFLLFGSGVIASGLVGASETVAAQEVVEPDPLQTPPNPHARSTPPRRPVSPFGDDPNAGVAVNR